MAPWVTRYCYICTLTLVILAAGCSSDSGDSKGCKTDKDCTQGICACPEDQPGCDEMDKSCQLIPCEDKYDCGGQNRACVEMTEGKFCGQAECDEVTDTCPEGKVCEDGACVAESKTCMSNSDCDPATQKCVQNECVSKDQCVDKTNCQAGETCENFTCVPASTDGTCEEHDDCAMGQYCDLTENVCQEGCSRDTECGDFEYCKLSSHTCEAGCSDDDDCEELQECHLDSHTCWCTEAYCTATDQICNPATGSCVSSAAGSLCLPCSKDSECGGGDNKCLPIGSATYCTQACVNVSDCPDGYVCYPYDSTNPDDKQCFPMGFSCEGCVIEGCDAPLICNFQSGECIEGKEVCEPCANTFECGPGGLCYQNSAGKNFCVQECVNGSCGSGFTCTSVPSAPEQQFCIPSADKCDNCIGVECSGNMPNCLPDTGQCVECYQNAHCTDGKVCDTGSFTCKEQSTTCPPDHPYLVDGQCVECLSNVDCSPGGTCDQITHACSGGSAPGNCQSDADCAPMVMGGMGGGAPTPTICDTSTGLCYDPNGMCDNINGFCNTPGGGQCSMETGMPIGICMCNMFLPTSCFAGQTCQLMFCAAN